MMMLIVLLLIFGVILFGGNAYIFIRLMQALPTMSMAVKVLVGVGMGVAQKYSL